MLKKIPSLNILLFLYHALFCLVAYNYLKLNNSDANLYWFQIEERPILSWGEYFNVGTDFMLFLNYPFAKILQLPFWSGFVIYAIIGYLGILQFKKLTYKLLGTEELKVFNVNLLPLLFFMPNLHFWTAIIGKETLCFFWLSTIFLKLAQKKYKAISLWLSLAGLFILRPHVFIMLVVPLTIIYLFKGNWSRLQKGLLALGSFILVGVSYYFFLVLSEIESLSWDRLQRFNLGSILSFKRSASYVPIHEYTYPEKLFAFFFRPFFFDAYNLNMYILSLENLFLLIFHLIIAYLFFKFYKKIKFATVEKIILGFVGLAFLLYVQRYAGLGIFVRTKIMLQPFLLIVLIGILQSSQILKKKIHA